MAEQMPLALADEHANDIAAAFQDGRMYLIVDKPVRSCGYRDSMVAGGEAADPDGNVTWVHVISKPAGVEMRGYARVGDELRLRLPAHPVEWPEVDAEVCRHLRCTRVVLPTPHREEARHV